MKVASISAKSSSTLSHKITSPLKTGGKTALKKAVQKARAGLDRLDKIATPPPGPLSKKRSAALKIMTLANLGFQLYECASLAPGANVAGAFFTLQQGLALYHLISPHRERTDVTQQKPPDSTVKLQSLTSRPPAKSKIAEVGAKIPAPLKKTGRKILAQLDKINEKLTMQAGPISQKHSLALKAMALSSIAFQMALSTTATMGANLLSAALWAEDGIVFLNLIPPGSSGKGEVLNVPGMEKLKRVYGKTEKVTPRPVKKVLGKIKEKAVHLHNLISPEGVISPRRTQILKLLNIVTTGVQVGICLTCLPPGFNVLAALSAFQEGVVLYNLVPLPNTVETDADKARPMPWMQKIIGKLAGLENRDGEWLPVSSAPEKSASGSLR